MTKMSAYHSTKSSEGCKLAGNVPILPLRNTSKSGRSFAPIANDSDIVDESLDLHKTNVFFKNFEVKDKSDLVLIYCHLYIGVCLKKLATIPTKEQATTALFSQALAGFALPGDANFPLNGFFNRPKTSSEQDDLKKYFTQLRQEIGTRLIERVFDPKLTLDEKPSKWWICFAKRNFLNAKLTE